MQNLIRYLRAASQSPRAKERDCRAAGVRKRRLAFKKEDLCRCLCGSRMPRSFRVSEGLGVRGIVHTINLVYKHITCPYIHVHRLFCNHSKRCDPERRCRRTTSVSVRELMEKYR